MAGTFCNVKLHIVFSVKHRCPLIDAALRPRLYEYIGGVVRGQKGTLLEIGGIDNHVHLLVGWRTDAAIADLVREIKSQSSLWTHQTFPEKTDFGWQSGYAVFSVSQSKEEQVRHYIQYQEMHHARRDFREEYLALLRAHGLKFEEKYVFD